MNLKKMDRRKLLAQSGVAATAVLGTSVAAAGALGAEPPEGGGGVRREGAAVQDGQGETKRDERANQYIPVDVTPDPDTIVVGVTLAEDTIDAHITIKDLADDQGTDKVTVEA